MNCSACGVANDPNARFCASCGKPLAQPQAPQAPPPALNPFASTAIGSGPPICAACGADFVAGKCDRCGGTQSTLAPAPTQGVHWVQLRLSLKCMTCQRASPLERLDMEGRYFCYGCGREAFFDADLWEENILYNASALGDAFWSNVGVFSPWPQNDADKDTLEDHDELGDVDIIVQLFDKFRTVGRTTCGLTMEHGGMSIGAAGMRTRGIAMALAPGHPLCVQCKTPLQVQTPAEGLVATTCVRCNLHETYRLPPGAEEACDELVGVIAPEHVEGRQTARLMPQPGSAALAVTCPKCGSGLQLAPGARITHCSYCKTTSVVPEQIAAAGAAPKATPDPIWLAFRSPSGIRDAIIESAQQKNAPPDHRHDEHDGPSSADERRAEKLRLAEEQRARSSRMGAIFGIVPVAIVAGVFVAFHLGAFDSALHKGDKKHEGEHSVDTTPTTASTKSKPAKSESVAMPSCTCSFGDGQSTPQVTLTLNAPPLDNSRGWSLGIDKTSGFISEGRTAKIPSQAGAVLPPAADAAAPAHMGIACDTGVFVLVADKTATGWSSVNGAWKWNTTLAAPSVDAADAGDTCAPLTVKNGSAALTLANGKHVSLSLKDGKIR